jgi:hypothetical protein
MSDIEMFHVGDNDKGEALYNLRYVKGGKSLPTPSMTKAEALAKVNGTEIVETETEDYKEMTKKELEIFMRSHNIELDRRKKKEDLLQQVDDFFKD